MDRLTRLFVLVMVAMASSIGMAGVTTVTLRATVRLAPDEPVTLGAIAAIEGDQRDAIASMPVTTDPVHAGAWSVLDAESVRRIIAESNAMEGSIIVVGRTVSLTRRIETPPTLHPANASSAADPAVVTLRDHLESWFRARFQATPDTARVRYEDRAETLLATPTDNRVVEVVEIGTSGRMALRVTVYENDRIVLTDTVRAEVEILTPACIVERPLRRGARIAEGDVRIEQIWTDPTQPPAAPETVVGQSVRRTLTPGETLRADHLEPPVVIQRGQDVSVRTVRGTVVVTTIARARSDAREGEIIELEAKDRSGRRFTARVSGPGRAVMVEPGQARRSGDQLKTLDLDNTRRLTGLDLQEISR